MIGTSIATRDGKSENPENGCSVRLWAGVVSVPPVLSKSESALTSSLFRVLRVYHVLTITVSHWPDTDTTLRSVRSLSFLPEYMAQVALEKPKRP